MKIDSSKPLFQLSTGEFMEILRTINSEKGASLQPGPAPKEFKLYDNAELKALLHVGDKLIQKYRDDGLLSFHKVGDKFWYTQEDVDQFLKHSFNEAYSYM